MEPEVWFRIVHLAQEDQNGAPVASYREQTVEIALGPKGAFVNGNIGALTRQVLLEKGFHARLSRRHPGNPRHPGW
jgi:hypothetical protein